MVCALSFSCVQLFVTSWMVACQDTWDIIQVRILEWVAYSFSRAFSQPRNWTGVSCITGRFFTSWSTREALNWYAFTVKYYTWSLKMHTWCIQDVKHLKYIQVAFNIQIKVSYWHKKVIKLQALIQTIISKLICELWEWWTSEWRNTVLIAFSVSFYFLQHIEIIQNQWLWFTF